jgi:L-threonylcarbamoyladenylate synthase
VHLVAKKNLDMIKSAAKNLIAGNLVIFPTETVYGLGADANNIHACRRIYTVKNRPMLHPVIVHISSMDHLSEWAIDISDFAIKLAKEFWPGPVTLILKRSPLAKDFVTGGQNTVGLRIPNHPIALELLREFNSLGGSGIAAPSANRFGAVSPTDKVSAFEDLSKFLHSDDLILDGGQSSIGIESTIIDCTFKAPVILRPGSVTSEMIEDLLHIKIMDQKFKKAKFFPGSFKSHYSPRAVLKLNCQPKIGEGFIAMSEIPTPKGAIRLASPANDAEFARQMYSAFRMGDKLKLQTIVAVTPRGQGISVAIRDRLTRASKV